MQIGHTMSKQISTKWTTEWVWHYVYIYYTLTHQKKCYRTKHFFMFVSLRFLISWNSFISALCVYVCVLSGYYCSQCQLSKKNWEKYTKRREFHVLFSSWAKVPQEQSFWWGCCVDTACVFSMIETSLKQYSDSWKCRSERSNMSNHIHDRQIDIQSTWLQTGIDKGKSQQDRRWHQIECHLLGSMHKYIFIWACRSKLFVLTLNVAEISGTRITTNVGFLFRPQGTFCQNRFQFIRIFSLFILCGCFLLWFWKRVGIVSSWL